MAVRYAKTAIKVLNRLDKKRRVQIAERLKLVEGGDNRNVEPLKGMGAERLRLGDVRVIFQRKDNEIAVLDIGFRGDVV